MIMTDIDPVWRNGFRGHDRCSNVRRQLNTTSILCEHLWLTIETGHLSVKSTASCKPPYHPRSGSQCIHLLKLALHSTLQLLATAGLCSMSFVSEGYRTWIQGHPWMVWVSLFGAIGMMLLTFWKRKSYPANLLFLSGFTALEAYSVSVITSFYDPRIVLEALIFTLAIFVALTLFACQTKYDFTSWMPYLFGALWVLIIFGMSLPNSNHSQH